MEPIQKTSSRKKFLLWSATVLSSLTVLNLISGSKQKKNETVKMLTQDGKLVEVDREKIFDSKKQKITDEQLKKWVNKKQS
jgi:hypothetical protein